MYRAYGLLKPDSDFNLDMAAARLAAKFPGAAINWSGERIAVEKGDWEIHFELHSGPEILAESADLAEKIAGTVDGVDIESCDRRVEVASDTSDPMMEHFNDFLNVIEVLRSFNGLIAVDPQEPALM